MKKKNQSQENKMEWILMDDSEIADVGEQDRTPLTEDEEKKMSEIAEAVFKQFGY